MTEAEQLADTMELGRASRLAIALELLKARRFIAACRRRRNSLPWQLRDLLDARYPDRDFGPPPDPTLSPPLL
ncbi:MAG: hypothetical protein EPO27_10445 [Betaproteobacteria bacterium]|nr:MAG: hypothetical protein EPO27_10445 [Betaproteobacteria bacterium]